MAVDEIPNFQGLEHKPIRPALPGRIEQREFEYIRHDTVNLLLFLIIHTGRMELALLDAKDAEPYYPGKKAAHKPDARAKGCLRSRVRLF